MGVHDLWEILSPIAEVGISLTELSGKVLAVDLSGWIVEFRSCKGTSKLANLYLRNLFYRTLDFMKEGVQLIFVLDGTAPEIKWEKLNKQRESTQIDRILLQRPNLERYSAECVALIECLGIPWLYSSGEGEKMCAYLNQKGGLQIVNGCITEDNDFFCYGGKTVYRNLRKEKKLYVVDHFEMDKVEIDLGFCRKDLVAMALLLGCDYNQGGVKTVGKDRAVTLLKTWKEREIDSLQRILNWHTNKDLDIIEEKAKTRSHKEAHCTKCSHTGNIKSHQRIGCSMCKTEADCNESCDISCECDWHQDDQLIQRHKLELTTRQRSKETINFVDRSKKIVDEYMKSDSGLDKLGEDDIKPRPINFKALVEFLGKKIGMEPEKVYETITPVVIISQLFQDTDEFMYYTPVRVERTSKHCGIEGYLVSWDKTDKNIWPMASSTEVKIEKKLFTKKFPQLVNQFLDRVSSKPPKGQRKAPSRPVADTDCATPAMKTKPYLRQENRDQATPKKKSLKQHQPVKGQQSLSSFFTKSSDSQPLVSQASNSEPSTGQLSDSQASVSQP